MPLGHEKGASQEHRTIAVISGKGGSGKTKIRIVIAMALSGDGRTLLIDGDTGTGGLTYYLGMDLVENTAVGLSDLVSLPRESLPERLADPPLQVVSTRDGKVHFLGVGNHRLLYRDASNVPAVLVDVIETLKQDYKWTIIDCRGGIDDESRAVCDACDDSLLIVEPDTTSFQASQHVVEILGMSDCAAKLRGFIINKVFDDPSVVARIGTSVFRTQYLASIPFDMGATRKFLVGQIPDARSPFSLHVRAAIAEAYPETRIQTFGQVWRATDYNVTNLSTIDSVRGGIVILGGILLVSGYWCLGSVI